MNNTERILHPKMVTPYNAQNIGNREEQQDYFAYSNIYDREERERSGIVAVLADGMGGMENGSQASHAATQVFLQTYLGLSPDNDIRENMVVAVREAQAAVSELSGAGSTLVAVVIKDWQLYWLSVGDSRIYLYRNKRIQQLNTEHNYAALLQRMVENGEISPEEAINNPDRAALTSYLGIEELEEIDMNTEDMPLRRGDSILLCSDGLYNSLADEEIARIIDDADDDVCTVMIDAALSKGVINQDNVTVMLMDID